MNKVIRHIKDGTLFKATWNWSIYRINYFFLKVLKLPHVYNYLDYKRQFGLLKSIKNPKTFSQKIYYLRDKYNENPLATQVADKLEVRKYVESLGLGHILNELIAVYDSAEEINFESLPDQFVMKTNHACGTNIIVKDKSQIDEKAILKKLDKWLKKNYAFSSGELQYLNIKPKIIVEKFLEDGNSSYDDLQDYQVWCFNGKAEFFNTHRYLKTNFEKEVVRFSFDLHWRPISIFKESKLTQSIKINTPICIKNMIKHAETLSAPFSFARVDFYDIDNKVILGEITLTPTGGNNHYFTTDSQLKYGNKLKLNIRKLK